MAAVPVPVTVIVYVPGGVLDDVDTVIADDEPAVTVLGLKLAVAPAGRPEADKATCCALPDVTAV
ncbi:hypothetical protein ABT186_12255, partial [Streptomyces sp. NPDC001634]